MISSYNCYFREGRKPATKPQKIEFPKKVPNVVTPVNKFANESVKRSKPAESQLANKIKYSHSKGGLRDRSRDFVSTRTRDPSIKFPGSRPLVVDTTRTTPADSAKRASYQPSQTSTIDERDSKIRKLAKLNGVAYPSSIRKRTSYGSDQIRSKSKGSIDK